MWCDIDLDSKLWHIKGLDMKMKRPHTTALSDDVISILKEQYLYSKNSEFIFPSINKHGHLHRDSLSKALRTLENGKYNYKVTAHGFRATFKTICTLNLTTLCEIKKVFEENKNNLECDS